jgi:hypothetical protein
MELIYAVFRGAQQYFKEILNKIVKLYFKRLAMFKYILLLLPVLLLITPYLSASDNTWISSTLLNTNTTDIKVEKIKVKDDFKDKFAITDKQAVKAVYRLQKEALKEYDKDTPILVDIFISDVVPVMDLNDDNPYSFELVAHPSASANEIYVIKDGIKLSALEGGAVLDTYKKAQKEKRDKYNWARKQNLESVIELLKNELSDTIINKLNNAANDMVPYVTLGLKPHALEKLLSQGEDTINAIDIHINFSKSGIDQEPHEGDTQILADWRARFKNYLQITHVSQWQEDETYNYTNWGGLGIDIYYANGQCPVSDDATFDGYTPINEDRYTILPSNTAGYIPKAYHTKILTGILSTVSPDANLFCKNAEIFGDDTTDYNDPNFNVFDYVLPTASEMESTHIETYSINQYSSALPDDTTRDYYPMDMLFDNHAYEYNIPIFISAGNYSDDNDSDDFPNDDNTDNDIVSPAKAFNIVTVGNYSLDEFGSLELNNTSSYNNPLLGGTIPYQKPEISAPGSGFYYTELVSNSDPEHTYSLRESLTSGTSFATPFAAAITANIMSSFAVWDNNYSIAEYGAMYKAAIISLARDSVYINDDNISDYHSRVGEGGINYKTIPYMSYITSLPENTIFTQTVAGRQCYNSNAPIEIDSYNNVRFVIAWFNKVPNANITRIPNTYTLEVLAPDNNPIGFYDYNSTYRYIAVEENQGYQVINFRTGDTPIGSYIARICETENHDEEELKMGLSATLEPYPPPHPPAPGVLETIISYLLW